MPVITQIKQQKDKDRVNVYLDGKFGFGIDLENFVKLGLRVEQELTQEQIDEITKKAEFQKVLAKILQFAMVRPRSEKEYKDWLKRKKVPESLFEKLLAKLKKFDLLDDEKFAAWWVDQRREFRPKPKSILYYELSIKGINREIIRQVLDTVEIDEEKIAKNLLERNNYKWKRFDKVKSRQKKTEFLGRKGFGWDVIKKVIN